MTYHLGYGGGDPAETGDGDIDYERARWAEEAGHNQEAPDPRYIPDPGFSEQQVDDWPDPDHGREDRVGGILRQADQWPDAVAFNRQARGDAEPYKEFGHSGTGNLEPGQYVHNRDPEMGTTVPHMVGGDPAEAVTDARVMHPHETGLEYPVLARPSGHGNGFDVIKPLG
jgi:hypothetical protein